MRTLYCLRLSLNSSKKREILKRERDRERESEGEERERERDCH